MDDTFPELPEGRCGIIVGAHSIWTERLTNAVEKFCKAYNAVVFCDNTSNYKGQYAVPEARISLQDQFESSLNKFDLLIHIGNISGSYMKLYPQQVWRVNPDGEVRDTFRKLTGVFEVSEAYFFEQYTKDVKAEDFANEHIISKYKAEQEKLFRTIPDLPFSNLFIASKMANKIPGGSVLFLGIFNTLRSWNFFDLPETVSCYANTGGFGIEGGMSSLIGASFNSPEKLYFGVFGDLGFFYDMNVLGNRHIGKNLRIVLVNNGGGIEFRNYNHYASIFEKDAAPFIAAAGHYGNRSKTLVRHFAEDLNFTYMSASSKEEFEGIYEQFLNSEGAGRSILFEIFTTPEDESNALKLMNNAGSSPMGTAKAIAKKILSPSQISFLKHLVRKN